MCVIYEERKERFTGWEDQIFQSFKNNVDIEIEMGWLLWSSCISMNKPTYERVLSKSGR